MLCWYCEKAQMKDALDMGSGWVKCPKCGATWIESVRLASSKRKAKK